MINLILALIGVMIADILLDSSLAKIKREFNKKALINSIFKVFCIVFGFSLMVISSYLTEDIVVARINNIDMNLLEAMKTVLVTAIIVYSGKDLVKLANLFKVECAIGSCDSNNKEGAQPNLGK